MSRSQGFTLLELLLVCTIIGILGAVGLTGFRGASERARVGEAATQLAADLQRARSAAQRYNQDASFRVGSTNAQSYTLTVNGQTTTRRLPAGTQITVSSPLTLTYSAPFGVLSGSAAARINVTSQNQPSQVRYVKVIGVTGKVYLSERP